MKDVGVKAVYDGEFKNDEGNSFKMFHTVDFAETIAIKASFVSAKSTVWNILKEVPSSFLNSPS